MISNAGELLLLLGVTLLVFLVERDFVLAGSFAGDPPWPVSIHYPGLTLFINLFVPRPFPRGIFCRFFTQQQCGIFGDRVDERHYRSALCRPR